MNTVNNNTRPVWLLLILLLPAPLFAAAYDGQEVNFSLLVESRNTELRYTHNSRRTKINRISAVWNQDLSSRLSGGIRLAYLDLSQPSNPIPAGMTTTGYGIGFSLLGRLIKRKMLHMNLWFAYDYQATRGSSDEQTTEILWHEMGGGADLIIFPHATVSLLAGAAVTRIDGDERNSGTINRVSTFNEDQPVDYYAGLNIRTDPGGHIGLKWYSGLHQGFTIHFNRQF